MKNPGDITVQEVNNLSYTDFIALIRETNRCPGGKDTIRRVIQNSFVNRESRILEIGSNTGFTSLEVAHLVKCRVDGIDVSKNCVLEAKNKLSQDTEEVKKLVNFQVGSAYEIPFDNDTFDLLIGGGATSFMDKKSRAVSEYVRVVKPWGFISVTQLFYAKRPPIKVVDAVSAAIGVKINPWEKDQWLSIFTEQTNKLERYYFYEGRLTHREPKSIDDCVNYFLSKPHIQELKADVQKAIGNKWKGYLEVFNENHKYLGYFTVLLRKTQYDEEPELFIRK